MTFNKIKTRPQAQRIIDQWKLDGQKVVFTNGCFDLLHFGHIFLLGQCSSLGDKLVIGLNSRDSVRRLKGAHRPIQDELSRLAVLDALEMVDMVVIFEEDTPLELIKALRPDVLVKGGDYLPAQVVGAQEVESWGGEVKIVPYQPGFSTTLTEQKIRPS